VKRRLPIRLHLKHGAYYYVHRVDGKVRWRKLSKDYGEALRLWADLEGGQPNHAWTVADAIAHYLGVSAKRLKPATLAGYEENAKRLLPVFGAMPIADLRRAHVYSYVVKRGNVAGNRERALLSAVYAHLGKAGIFEGDNPAAGLQFRNPEKPRRRYATDGELEAILAQCNPRMRLLVRFAYLTGMRQADVLGLKLTAAREDGIAYRDSKTDRDHLLEWTDELRQIWKDAAGLRIGAVPVFLARDRDKEGRQKGYTSSGFRASWRAVKKRAGLMAVTFHDLRRKAGSDADDDAHAQALLGHEDGKITRKHYRAKIVPVRPIGASNSSKTTAQDSGPQSFKKSGS
jgi:integrase